MKYEYFIHLPMEMEPIVSSETSAIRTQTPGNYPKRNNLHLEHGESLRTRLVWLDTLSFPTISMFVITNISKRLHVQPVICLLLWPV